jgi:SAM-dependent methyltransferase
MGNINDHFFEGQYKEIWRTMIPEILTERELDFMIPYFQLQEGQRVLDLMCGYGRHALALARKGIHVTAVDNLEAYTTEIKTISATENLPVEVVQADIVGYVPSGQYELAICMGNSLNFFNRSDLQQILHHLAAALIQGAALLINSWSIAEIVFHKFKSDSEGKVGESGMKTRQEILFRPARIEAETEFTAADGSIEIKKGIDYIYSLNEMEAMLSEAGLALEEVYSIPGRKPFTLGEPRAYLVARKK